MRVRLASQPAPGSERNEDYGFVAGALVGVLDGVTAPRGLDTGCVHGPAWFVHQLAARLIETTNLNRTLADCLEDAIVWVGGEHRGHCDLGNPSTPAATVCLLRDHGEHIEYLVLCDSPLVLDRGTDVQMVRDERFERIAVELRRAVQDVEIGSDEHARRTREIAVAKQERINQPNGYWIAASTPEAAHHAITGTLPMSGPDRVRRAALLTDGASCAVDRFGLFDWRGLLDLLTDHGPEELIKQVRLAEVADSEGREQPRYKRHDDATAALCLFDEKERRSL